MVGVLLVVGSLEFVGRFEEQGWKLAGTIVSIAYTAWSLWLLSQGRLVRGRRGSRLGAEAPGREREPGTPSPDAWLEFLEGRRLAYDAQLWQGPTLVIAAQAILLSLLTNERVGWLTAMAVALAGVIASVAAIVSLAQQHGRR